MAPEDAAIRVQLVDDDVAKVLEERRPLRVMRQDPRVQHVGIREDEIRPRAHGATGVLRRVTVVREHPQLGQLLGELLELRQLVLRQRLRRKQIQDSPV